jgi:transcription elongation factor GreA
MTLDTGAPSLLRSVGLLVDGPGQWGRPIPAPGPGVFIVELAAPLANAPIELTRIGKWIERVETLRLDGARPISKALAARLAAAWLPSQTILYIGASDVSVRRRLSAMSETELGDRRPYPGGYWLKTLRGLDSMRIWWASTTATEEYEDALLEAFAAGVPDAERAGLADHDVVLPFANLRRGTGVRKSTGLTGALLAEPVMVPVPPRQVVDLPEGDAEGARGEPPPSRRTRLPIPGGAARASSPRPGPTPTARRVPASEALTVEGSARLRAELHELTRVRRPDVIARIRTAKEHGDLKENSEYAAARQEQSFLEGRVQALEARLRTAVIVDAPAAGARVGLGSQVTVEDDGDTVTYTIVGASESDPGSGRISSASPVGRALVGHDVDDKVTVRTPAGERHYRIVAIT